MNSEKSLDEVKEKILKDYPRLGEKDKFQFKCHAGLPCFNQCCGDVTIVLTPYDILRMKRALNMSSEEFLGKYTFVPFHKEQKFPVVILKLNDDDKKTCPFVSDKGCSIYENRPWACRMYPIGLASPAGNLKNVEEFYFVIKERPCDGLDEKKEWTVSEWVKDQGIDEYNKMGESFKGISLHPKLLAGMELTPPKVDMIYMASYDLDKFRRFIFESTFISKIEIDPKVMEKIKTDDLELMKFAFDWLKFSVFGEKTLAPKESILEMARKAKENKS